METKLNIAKILKDKPQGTKLYSSACGKCELKQVDDNSFKISFYNSKFGFMNGGEGHLDKFGKLYDDGECVIFPSKEMREWSKFAWKKGDVLVSNDSTTEVIFNGWKDDTYTLFCGAYALTTHKDGKVEYGSDSLIFETCNYKGIEVEDAAQRYINYIEKRLGGKLNLETLEIENQLEFKDGDIVVADAVPSLCYSKCIFILKGDLNTSDSSANSYIFYNVQNDMIHFNVLDENIRERNIHLATDSEKQQLFNALADGNKAWDAEKKQVVSLKPKDKFKPFDKVLVKDNPYGSWKPAFFWKKDDTQDLYPYKTIEGKMYRFCEPYEGNEHLLDN